MPSAPNSKLSPQHPEQQKLIARVRKLQATINLDNLLNSKPSPEQEQELLMQRVTDECWRDWGHETIWGRIGREIAEKAKQ